MRKRLYRSRSSRRQTKEPGRFGNPGSKKGANRANVLRNYEVEEHPASVALIKEV
jgi:hypothetical protein